MPMEKLFDRHECYLCGIRKDPEVKGSGRSLIEVHHIVEQSEGGKNHERNKVAVCSNCHSRIHTGEFTIRGWFMSTKGWILIWHDGEKDVWGKGH